jgi:uncharacterized cupin superfamily protein
MNYLFDCGKWLVTPGRGAPLAALAAVGIALAGASLSANRPPAAAPAIIRIDQHLGADALRGKYPPDMVAPGQKKFDGAYREAIAFSTTDKQYFVRVWESGPGVLKTDDYPYDEYCLILSGRLQITNASGSTEEFGPGDSFVIPKGWRGTWDMKTRTKKIYIDLIPAAAAPPE